MVLRPCSPRCVQPRIKRAVPAERTDGAVGLDERLLGDVLGSLGSRNNRARADDLGLIPNDQQVNAPRSFRWARLTSSRSLCSTPAGGASVLRLETRRGSVETRRRGESSPSPSWPTTRPRGLHARPARPWARSRRSERSQDRSRQVGGVSHREGPPLSLPMKHDGRAEQPVPRPRLASVQRPSASRRPPAHPHSTRPGSERNRRAGKCQIQSSPRANREPGPAGRPGCRQRAASRATRTRGSGARSTGRPAAPRQLKAHGGSGNDMAQRTPSATTFRPTRYPKSSGSCRSIIRQMPAGSTGDDCGTHVEVAQQQHVEFLHAPPQRQAEAPAVPARRLPPARRRCAQCCRSAIHALDLADRFAPDSGLPGRPRRSS